MKASTLHSPSHMGPFHTLPSPHYSSNRPMSYLAKAPFLPGFGDVAASTPLSTNQQAAPCYFSLPPDTQPNALSPSNSELDEFRRQAELNGFKNFVTSSPNQNSSSTAANIQLGTGPSLEQSFPFATPSVTSTQNPVPSLAPTLPRLPSVNGSSLRLQLPKTGGAVKRPTPGATPTRSKMISGGDLAAKLTNHESVLILDMRCADAYTTSHIQSAVNICLPSMMLRRHTLDALQKLPTLNEAQKEQFSQWQSASAIIVYTSLSTETDLIAMMLSKFSCPDPPALYTLQDGFEGFSAQFPDLVASKSLAATTAGACPDGSTVPLVGGMGIPAPSKKTLPFFSNIRQNIELPNGVGQNKVCKPAGLNTQSLPQWLQSSIDVAADDRKVCDKFLGIEKGEQQRLQKALSAEPISIASNTACAAAAAANGDDIDADVVLKSTYCVTVAGIERGDKNRYKDILPFDETRVRLQRKSGAQSDYINASFLQAPDGPKYVATQGPLPDTCCDFWQMVWDERIHVIVMLTAEMEAGRVKCHKYWQNATYGKVKVSKVEESQVRLSSPILHPLSQSAVVGVTVQNAPPTGASSGFEFPVVPTGAENTSSPSGALRPGSASSSSTASSASLGLLASAVGPTPNTDASTNAVTIRRFTLTHAETGEQRQIAQVHYPLWPDLGAPEPKHLLELVEIVQGVNGETVRGDRSSSPILVHCSAGCGRTGAFCTVDTVLDILNGAHAKSNVDLVERTVEHFRRQRVSMVQNLAQFVLCYETVLAWYLKRQNAESHMTD